jgi:tricorn protease
MLRRAILYALLAALPLLGQSKLLRFPDVHGDKVAFVHAGDIWVVSSQGGAAHRLTAHPGLELFPKFSPDGKWIAFTGQYDGDEQVYVMPAEGGVPKQLTFYPAQGPLPQRWGYDNQVEGWTPDGKNVLFRSYRDGWSLSENKLYTVPAAGGPSTPLPMPHAGSGSYSPDAKRIAYSPLFRDFRNWKRYQGGWAQDLYIYDFATNRHENFTNNPRTDRDPMWIGNKIYFSSDRDGTLNLYSYDIASKRTTELTHSNKWDVRWPSSDHVGQIVYEAAGELHVYDVRDNRDRKLSIEVPDDGLHSRPGHVQADNLIEDFALSPKGERALFVARGDVFTVPIEHGAVRNLTNSSNAHERWARWSPDGKRIAFISDRSGEDEVWIVDQDGNGKPEQLTHDGNCMRYAPEWAPDGKRIAFSDSANNLSVMTMDDKKVTQVAHDRRNAIRNYTWSQDGGHLAFTVNQPNGYNALHIWSVADNQNRQITDGFFDVGSPAWDPEGNYLYYMSRREYQPMIGTTEFNYATGRDNYIYAMTLRKDVKNPLAPESDEVTITPDKKEDKKDEKKDAPKEYLKIDFDGLAARVARLPVDADNYGGLTAIKGYLLYGKFGSFYYGRDSETQPSLRAFSLKDRKESTVMEKIRGWAVSDDGSKLLTHSGNEFRLLDLPPKAVSGPAGKVVSTRGLAVDRVPKEEWSEIFEEVWRRYRDFFYVSNMNGYDWKALHDQYKEELQYVDHRADLNYVISEMISELNNSHTYIAGGDWTIPQRPQVALPGARFALDAASGRYKLAQIFKGQNEEDRYRSPLTEIGIDVKEGDYVLAVDGEELKPDEDPYKLLRNKADRTVTLTVNDKPTIEGSRKIVYKPITTETPLVYLDMTTRNAEIVNKLTNGKAGYIHIPDMGAQGIAEFIKHYYAQIRKEALVIDDRGNGGGNVSRMIIERLRRVVLAVDFGRTDEDATTYPDGVFMGPMVCLLNETSSSDGDIFPYMFRKAGLGLLIGKRSWGGVVGINNTGPLLDGGVVNVPTFALATTDGQWAVEGHGVDPDIVVDNDPAELLKGHDQQLERAVAEVMAKAKAKPAELPKRPAAPVRK